MKNELTDYEKKMFSGLQKEAAPDSDLRNRIIGDLKSDGFIEPKRASSSKFNWGISIAASLILFVLGVNVGQKSASVEQLNTDIDPLLGYALLLYEDENFIEGESSARAVEYGNWMRSLAQKGIRIHGQELANESSVINGQSLSEGALTGYFLLEAYSMEDVIAIAESIPHVKYGGIVEVKKFVNR